MGCLKFIGIAALALCLGLAIVAASVATSPGGVLSNERRDVSRDGAAYCGAAAGQMAAAGYGRMSGPASVMPIGAGAGVEFACSMTLGGQAFVVRVKPVCGEPLDCASIRAIQSAEGVTVWVRGE